MAQVGSTENRPAANKTDVCLESYPFETEQITLLNQRYNLYWYGTCNCSEIVQIKYANTGRLSAARSEKFLAYLSSVPLLLTQHEPNFSVFFFFVPFRFSK